MSRSLLRMEMIGNIGKEPEYSNLPNGTLVARFSLAVARDYKTRETSEKVEKTVWVPLKAYNRNAEILQEFCQSGSKLYVECEYNPFEYEKDGERKFGHDFTVHGFQMLNSRQDSQKSGQQEAPPEQRNDFDDDIPF